MNKTGLIDELIVQDGWQRGWTAIAPGLVYDGWMDGLCEDCEGSVCVVCVFSVKTIKWMGLKMFNLSLLSRCCVCQCSCFMYRCVCICAGLYVFSWCVMALDQ